MALPVSSRAWLESGDQLDAKEFLRRYEQMPEDFRAELIEGVVYVAAAIRFREHGKPMRFVLRWLEAYADHHPGLEIAPPSTLLLDDHNVPEPDVALWDPARGAARVNDNGYIEGAPELVVEIAASSVSRDANQKKRAYERNGVQEYVIWRVLDEAIDWYRLSDGKYQLVAPDSTGVIESETLPGLRLDVSAMLKLDITAVRAQLR